MAIATVLFGVLMLIFCGYALGRKSLQSELDRTICRAAAYAQGLMDIYHMPDITVNDARAMAMDAVRRAVQEGS
jgi:hypothetical protein